MDKALRDVGCSVETINDWRDVTFGGRSPEPGEDHVDELRKLVKSKKLTLGIATDGDADRFGIIDSDGSFITLNQLIAILTDYLAESRGWTNGVARSVATSHLVDRVAKERNLKLYETPVGFKFIGELINKDEIILGGEESAGLSIRGHYPEKDGILACLLAIEAVTVRQASLNSQLEDLYRRVGKLESGRIGVKLNDDVSKRLKEKLAQEPTEIAGRKVENINRMDGVKFLFAANSWMLMRPSGTEPMVRIYAEAKTSGIWRNYLMQGGGTYSNRSRAPKKSTSVPRKSRSIMPRWVPYGTTALFALALCFTINFRAFTELTREVEQHESLNQEIEKLTSENLNLQEEIYYLHNDSSVIEREAKKFGFQRKEKKVLVPVDK
ncbi:MAG: hypothetical protein ABI481_07115 [Pyrinomonadaceae bacterium]